MPRGGAAKWRACAAGEGGMKCPQAIKPTRVVKQLLGSAWRDVRLARKPGTVAKV